MKRTNLMIALLIVAFSTATLANISVRDEKSTEKTRLKVIPKEHPAKFDLIYVSEIQGPVTVEILNMKGELVAIDRIKKHNSFIKTYDLTKLGAGTYKMKVINSEGETDQIINYNPIKQNLRMAYNTREEGKINITVAGVDKGKPVVVKVYDDEGSLLSSEELNVTRDFTRTYNVSHLDTKSFTISASNGRESVIKHIEL